MLRPEPSSFRDPSGFLFWDQGSLYRLVNPSYQLHYDHLMESGLYARLQEEGLLIPHREVDHPEAGHLQAYRILQPEMIEFISYPYEWSFSQLQDAALTVLRIQKISLGYGMTLKDASAYNMQFRQGKPLLIDTLSFEKYEEGSPWVAYRQFCQHFLAPLALMAYTDIRLSQLLRIYIDGVPLDLASRLLPGRTRCKFALLAHIHWHARSQKQYEDQPQAPASVKMSRRNLLALLDNLISAVSALKWQAPATEWGDYYQATNYTDQSFQNKLDLVRKHLEETAPRNVWDLGANTGVFSRLASDRNIYTVGFDIDPLAVEKNYLAAKAAGEKYILPLLLDLTNPSPALGWANQERQSLFDRNRPELVMALALLHHLVIGNNVPLDRAAQFFSQIADHLIIEFIPKTDSQVQRMLASREDIFPNYDQEHFEQEFSRFYTIKKRSEVEGSQRSLYLMQALPKVTD